MEMDLAQELDDITYELFLSECLPDKKYAFYIEDLNKARRKNIPKGLYMILEGYCIQGEDDFGLIKSQKVEINFPYKSTLRELKRHRLTLNKKQIESRVIVFHYPEGSQFIKIDEILHTDEWEVKNGKND